MSVDTPSWRVEAGAGWAATICTATICTVTICAATVVLSMAGCTETARPGSDVWVLSGDSGADTGAAPDTGLDSAGSDGAEPDTTGPELEPPYFGALSSGPWFTCGLQPSTERIKCWGQRIERYGLQPPTTRFRGLAAGAYHVCGLRASDGSAECWGSNQFGQLDAPQGAFTEITAGMVHTCGLREDGGVVCWGMGDGDGGHREHGLNFEQAMAPSGQFSTLSAGLFHTCGIEKASGRARCWGLGSREDGGEAAGADLTVAVDADQAMAPEGERFEEVAAGGWHSCGITEDGQLRCWGGAPDGAEKLDFGQSNPPQKGPYTRVAAGIGHTCALDDEGVVGGRLTCWGLGGDGDREEWDGDSDFFKDADQVRGLTETTFSHLTAGGIQTCATALGNGLVHCWGGIESLSDAQQQGGSGGNPPLNPDDEEGYGRGL